MNGPTHGKPKDHGLPARRPGGDRRLPSMALSGWLLLAAWVLSSGAYSMADTPPDPRDENKEATSPSLNKMTKKWRERGEQRFWRQLHAERLEKTYDWKDKRIGDRNARDFVNGGLHFLLAGEPETLNLTIEEESEEAGVVTAQLSAESMGGMAHAGSMTLITPDGYYLTAAHCVDQGPVYTVGLLDDGLKLVPVRVVWSSVPNGETYDRNQHPLDLALVHMPSPHSDRSFRLIPRSEPIKQGKEVYIAGYGGGYELDHHPRPDSRQKKSKDGTAACGLLVEAGSWQEHPESGARWRVIQHQTLLVQGDSGGPLVDRHGRLLGVNVSGIPDVSRTLGSQLKFALGGRLKFTSHLAKAIGPDPAWIQSLIDQDRKRKR